MRPSGRRDQRRRQPVLADRHRELRGRKTLLRQHEGQFSSTKTFDINQNLLDSPGYVEYQASHVDHLSHQILINGQPLPGVDVQRTGHGDTGLQTHTDVIPFSFLRQGQNTIQFQRTSGDNFLIHHVIVHWREADPD